MMPRTPSGEGSSIYTRPSVYATFTSENLIMLDVISKTFWYFDENQMILESLGWGDGGKGDSVGRNAFAYICYPNEGWLKDTILQCIKMGDDGYLQFYRYPNFGANTMSRDHVGAIILAFYINRDKEELKWVLDNIPWKLSRRHSQTIDFWIWHRALKYEKYRWWFSQILYLITILQFVLIIPWNFLIRNFLGIKKINLEKDPKFITFVGWKKWIHKAIYPHYALFLLSWQIKVLSNSWLKKIVQLLLQIESGNEVINAVLGKKMAWKRWDYGPFIWARRMDNVNDVIPIKLIPEQSKYNNLNQAMVDYLYYGIDVIMLEYDDKIIRAIKDKAQIIQY